MKRINCIREGCNATIWETTTKKTDGMCIPCKKESDFQACTSPTPKAIETIDKQTSNLVSLPSLSKFFGGFLFSIPAVFLIHVGSESRNESFTWQCIGIVLLLGFPYNLLRFGVLAFILLWVIISSGLVDFFSSLIVYTFYLVFPIMVISAHITGGILVEAVINKKVNPIGRLFIILLLIFGFLYIAKVVF